MISHLHRDVADLSLRNTVMLGHFFAACVARISHKSDRDGKEDELLGISLRRIVFWGSYLAIAVTAICVYWKPEFLVMNTPVGMSRAVLFVIWVLFTGYSVYCIPKESLFESAKKILSLHWGRQVTADLYISALLSIALVWLVTQSIVETLFWSLAFIPYVNLVILLFIILHLDQIVYAFG